VTDPGGGHGWRSAPYLPRRRAGVMGLGRLADRAVGIEHRGLAVLLLPRVLEQFSLRDRAEDLLSAPGVVAVDPARVSYRALARLPDPVVSGLAAGQARRMNFPGTPRVVVIFHPLQYPLARAIIAHNPDAKLWYGDPPVELEEQPPPRLARRIAELDHMASMRADLRFDTLPDTDTDPDRSARERNRHLWERLEDMGVESGRLGSERSDVIRAWRGDS
jgi:hypothetical protein